MDDDIGPDLNPVVEHALLILLLNDGVARQADVGEHPPQAYQELTLETALGLVESRMGDGPQTLRDSVDHVMSVGHTFVAQLLLDRPAYHRNSCEPGQVSTRDRARTARAEGAEISDHAPPEQLSWLPQ